MTCHQNTTCIKWGDVVGTGEVFAEPFISAAIENEVECTSEGLLVPRNLQALNCATFPPTAATGVPAGFQNVVIESGTLTLANPTTDRVMQVIASVMFGAVRLVMTQGCAPSVSDFIQTAIAGSFSPFQPTDRVCDYSLNDNSSDPDAKSAITIPGACQTRVIDPSLPAGASFEMRYQRTYSVAGAGLADFLLQPTVIQLWGVVL